MGHAIHQFNARVRKIISDSYLTSARKKKPKANAPCVCGSGKTYKLCCGQSDSEQLFGSHITSMKLPPPQRNYPLAMEKLGRKWEADFAWVGLPPASQPQRLSYDSKPLDSSLNLRYLGVFLEGQVHAIKGKRTNDCERDNVLSILLPRWQIFKFTPQQVRDLVAIDSVKAWLSGDREATLAALQRKPKWN